jgi:hypothetical protein
VFLPRLGGCVTGAATFSTPAFASDIRLGNCAKGCANVLKETIFAGVLLAFMPRKPVPKAQVFDRAGATDLDPILAQVAADVGTHTATHAKADVWPNLTAIEAAKAFYLEMQNHWPEDPVEMRLVRQAYVRLSNERGGWPSLSDKALSQHLVKFGCKRRKLDLRKTGGGRVTAFEFPLETTAQKRRRRK